MGQPRRQRARRRVSAESSPEFPEIIASKLMVWSWELDDAQRGGLTTRHSVRYQLLQMQQGAELTHVRRGGRNGGIASVKDVLERFLVRAMEALIHGENRNAPSGGAARAAQRP